jgi:hypothetical protein
MFFLCRTDLPLFILVIFWLLCFLFMMHQIPTEMAAIRCVIAECDHCVTYYNKSNCEV